jgi:O-antigen ligase
MINRELFSRPMAPVKDLSTLTNRVPASPPRQTLAASGRPAVYTGAPLLQRFSFGILIAFLFMIFSRVFDVYFTSFHIPGISYRLVGIFLVMSGAFVVAFRSGIGKFVLAFTVCFLAAIPFGVWRTGSLQTLMDQWLVGFVVFVATASLIPDFRQYTRTVKTIAFAIVVLSVTSITMGTTENGRLFLSQGRFANPNEMAQALLLGMPFCWAAFSNSRSLLGKFLGLSSLGLMLVVIGKTGSRGALVSILVILVFLFVRASIAGKMKLLIACVMLAALAVVTLPGGLRARYQTFFSPEEPDVIESATADDAAADSAMLSSALSSTASRKAMLVRSLVITAKHPLLGVGPGNFMVAEDASAKQLGRRRGAWIGTHNSFTQVSSECGVPALICYVAVVVLSLKKSLAIYRRTRGLPQFREISSHALALNYSLIAFTVTCMFVHAAYTSLLPVLAGLTVSLVRTAESATSASMPQPAAAPAWSRPYRAPAPRFSPARSS